MAAQRGRQRLEPRDKHQDNADREILTWTLVPWTAVSPQIRSTPGGTTPGAPQGDSQQKRVD